MRHSKYEFMSAENGQKNIRAVSSLKRAVCVLSMSLAFAGMGMTAEAASVLPSGGVGGMLSKGSRAEGSGAGTENEISVSVDSIIEWLQAGNLITVSQEPDEEDLFRNLVIAQVNNYVNIRSIPSVEGEIVGKLYNNSVGTYVGEEDGWYLINSGSVTGYVKGEYCVTGEDAVEIAKQVGKRIATVTTQTLFIRREPTTESDKLGMLPEAEELLVLEEADGWVKVDIEGGTGWVCGDYVALHSEFVQAESREEEEARLAKEEEERRRAREAAAAQQREQQAARAAEQARNNAAAQAAAVSVGEGSEMGAAVAEYALQFVGNPYVYGGSSLTEGTDCSGFVMSVYANFGVSLPHSSAADRAQGYGIDGLENAQPGDLICYSGHVALYIGNGQIVHASNAETGIIVSNAGYRSILAIRRIF